MATFIGNNRAPLTGTDRTAQRDEVVRSFLSRMPLPKCAWSIIILDTGSEFLASFDRRSNLLAFVREAGERAHDADEREAAHELLAEIDQRTHIPVLVRLPDGSAEYAFIPDDSPEIAQA